MSERVNPRRAIQDLIGAANENEPSQKGKEYWVDELNKRHAVLSHGGKSRIMRFDTDGDFTLEAPSDLHTWYSNQGYWTKNDMGRDVFISASKAWLSSEHRRQYEKLVFDPSGRAPKGAYNLWQGFGVEPDSNASCDRILTHIRDVISAGNEAWFEYNVKYDAHLVQKPEEKPGVARVLRGGRGAGKDTYGELLRRICGTRHTAVIGDSQRLAGRFNSMFESALFAHVEEAFWSGDRRARGPLQHLITSPEIQIERKGLDPFTNKSFVRILMTTNEDWAVPAGPDERRYAVFDVGEQFKQDREYFGALRAEIYGAGAGAYLHYLQSLDISGFDVRAVPQTEALADQKRETLDALAQWWERELFTGELWRKRFTEGGGDVGGAVSRSELYGRYVAFVEAQRFAGSPKSPQGFGMKMRKLCPNLSDGGRIGGRANRDRFYNLPALAECERAFEHAIGVRQRRSKADLLA